MQDWGQRENKTKVNERDIELDKQHQTIVEEQEGRQRLLRGEISHLLFDIRNEIVAILHCSRRIIDNIFIEVAEEGAEELVDGLQELLEDGMDLELNIEGNRRRVWKTIEKRGKSKKGREKYIVMRLSRMQLSISSVFWFEEVWRAASNRNWM